MKRLLPLLLLIFALTSCASQTGSVVLPQESSVTSPLVAGEIALLKENAVHPYVLLDHAQTEDGILYAVPLDGAAGLDYFEVTPFQDTLLLYSQDWGEDEFAQLRLSVIDLKDGSTRAENTLEVAGYVMPQIIEDQLVISDSQTGFVWVLDADLQVTEEYTLSPDYNNWYLTPDASQLYHLGWSDQVQVTDLASGNTQEIELPARNAFFCEADPEQLTMSYVDVASQMQTVGYFDLTSGTLVPIPFDVAASYATRSGDLWLASDPYFDAYAYYLGSNATPDVIRLAEGGDELRLLDHDAQLLYISVDKTLTLYDRNGTFLARCETGLDENSFIKPDFIWSEAYGGYFFLVTHSEGGCQLLFWDVSIPTRGENLTLTPWTEEFTVAPGTAVDEALYERAARMSEDYGVVIRIADQCDTVFDSFDSTHLTEEYWIEIALDNLEEALGNYPKGFFQQLRFDSIRYVEIQLVGSLTATDEQWQTASYAAFASQQYEKYLVVMDGYQASTNNYYHEFSHIIDKRLGWDVYCRGEALYSEEHWRSLSPEDADYSYTYTDWPDIYFNDLANYFVDSYSRTYPTEDRARIMEYAMAGWLYDLENTTGIREKLDYYCRCIRDCFDTTGWPEVTLWEVPLSGV